MGAGMCNVCVMYQGMSSLSFSVARGGDWVDANVAADCGVTPAKVISIKENSQDFGYCLGVLHHTPDPQKGLISCVSKLKKGSPFLLYLYYRFHNRHKWYFII